MKIFTYLCLLGVSLVLLNRCTPPPYVPSIGQWEVYTLDFKLKDSALSESDEQNPFTDYRLMVLFEMGDHVYEVPGYFAADGNAGESGAETGNVWRVKFRPDKIGEWMYTVSFRKGENIAINDDAKAGEALYPDGNKGTFKVIAHTSPTGFESEGRLQYTGGRYPQFAGSGKYFLKGGPDSPENFLAYRDFDNTYSNWKKGENHPDVGEAHANAPSKDFTKTWEAHVGDWKEGDPTWQGGKGKGIIGALNYISDKGMNVVYMLTMNIQGDGRDVWPYISPDDFTRFDCSKLDQWEIVFTHAQNKGILLHFITQETENERLLDDGDTGPMRKLYYRELIARFGHHLAITWNLGEENGPANFSPDGQVDKQRKDMAKYLKTHDPMNNFVVIHTHSTPNHRKPILDSLLAYPYLDGISLQQGNPAGVHEVVKEYLEKSALEGHQWVINMDELGPHYKGALPDEQDPGHDTIRQDVLWGTLMAGGAGVEWYFGYQHPHNDLNCEDWRTRDILWEQTRHALDFFQTHLPFAEMESKDELIQDEKGFVLAKEGEVYAVYQPASGTTELDLSGVSGDFSVQWFDPRNGGELATGSVAELAGGSIQSLGQAPNMPEKDWVILLKKR